MELDAIVSWGLDRQTVRALSRRSDLRGLAQLSVHALLLCVSGWGVWSCRGTVWIVPAIVVHGLFVAFLFCPLHESVHRTAFASRWLNDTVAWICGALLLLPPEYFRSFHFTHHRYTQDPARDPELSTPPTSSVTGWLWRASGLPYWRERLTTTLRHALRGKVPETFIPPEKHKAIVREARLLWTCYLVVAVGSLLARRMDVLLYWVVPAIVGQPFLRLFLMAEHTGCEQTNDMFANTRTTCTNEGVRLLTWQMPFHAEHHAFPSVPFHALRRVNALVGEKVVFRSAGYMSMHRELLSRLRTGAPGSSASERRALR